MKAIVGSMLLTLLAACANVEPPKSTALIGDWVYADSVQSCRYSFKADGSFNGEVKQEQRMISKFTGRWTVTGKVLHYRYLSDVFGRIPPGAIDRDRLLEIKKGSFLIEAANGDRRRYVRVR